MRAHALTYRQLPQPAPGASGEQAAAPGPLQRSSGIARIVFKSRAGATALDQVHQSGCCKVRFPRPEPGADPQAVLLNTAGGLTDGDDIDTGVRWRPATNATVTTQAAERVYRSRGDWARMANRLRIDAGATALWLPQETILFDGGRLTRRMQADIAEGGRLLACEATIFGRNAMGEEVRHGAFREIWRVRCSGRLVFADGFAIEDDISQVLARPAIARGAGAIATLIFVGPGADALCPVLRDAMAALPVTGGCSVLGPVLVSRLLGPSGAELRLALTALIPAALGHLNEQSPVGTDLPRVWSC